MESSFSLKVFFVIVLLQAAIASGRVIEKASGSVEWVNRADVSLADLEPAGIGRFSIEYVVRAKYGSGYVPGKLYDYKGADHVFITQAGRQIQIGSNYELLKSPPGALSWIEGAGVQVSRDLLIFGGVDPETQQDVFICRATVEDTTTGEVFLLPGKFVPSKGICSVPYNKEHQLGSFELLVLNRYGVQRQVGNGRA